MIQRKSIEPSYIGRGVPTAPSPTAPPWSKDNRSYKSRGGALYVGFNIFSKWKIICVVLSNFLFGVLVVLFRYCLFVIHPQYSRNEFGFLNWHSFPFDMKLNMVKWAGYALVKLEKCSLLSVRDFKKYFL